MECQGVVTHVDTYFCFTMLNNKKVHWSLLWGLNRCTKLPEIGSSIKLKKVHQYGQTFVVCDTSILRGEFTKPIESNQFIEFIREHKLGAADLIKIDQIMKLFATDDLVKQERREIMLNILLKLLWLTEVKEITEHQCLNKQISHYNITMIGACRTVEISTNKYKDFPNWSFGIQSPATKDTLLFGYLTVHGKSAYLFIGDGQHSLPCIISKNSNDEHFFAINNSYVLIKNYKIISEIFSENVPCLEYLLVELDNVFLLSEPILNTEPVTFSKNLSFILKKKSMVCLKGKEAYFCYLEISLFDKSDDLILQLETIFLIVGPTNIKKTIILLEDRKYKLSYNQSLQIVKNFELSRLGKHKIYELIDSDAVFEKIGNSEKQQLLTVEDCKKNIVKSNAMVSFQGKINSKRLTSHRAKPGVFSVSKKYCFGTPGSLVHQLVFISQEDNNTSYLDCYLNNWENILVPLCLIPQIRVAVKHVLPISGRYLKSTIFTTFEILSYEPETNFQTVNLYYNDNIDWGPRSYLGLGEKIPSNVLIWGRVNIFILSLDISVKCKTCKKNTHVHNSFPLACKGTDEEIDFFAKLNVTDLYGQSRVFVKDKTFLKHILNLPDRNFDSWLEVMDLMKEYKFDVYNLDRKYEGNCEHIKNALTIALKLVNRNHSSMMDMKCRKVSSKSNKSNLKSLWLYIDARKV